MRKLKFTLEIIEAKDLKTKNILGIKNSNNVYIKLMQEEKTIGTTKKIKNNTTPKWDEKFIFTTNDICIKIDLSLYQHNKIYSTFMGNIKLSLTECHEMEVKKWIKFENNGNK
jgi:Ca2+-dependent lipid-binding protein